ncbi:alpha/beta fold hydrolase [Actinocorallia sp. API 0066]|uniref:alpha/beta fold hydrolase n=1 Tax=Actinocorallia sp. API 0066 TaxID=2896846 RepID=UPI001E2E4ED9|nr:alpha/beta fold hydrolase [Actinocorallia sp. API 0066]MCD0449439.1 alpha/beta fold hydrolase [Actinocorallia sp. API 0066]
MSVVDTAKGLAGELATQVAEGNELRRQPLQAVTLLDTLGLEKVHLVGDSYGGIVSLALARKEPERVGRIILMGGAGAPIPPTEEPLKLIT